MADNWFWTPEEDKQLTDSFSNTPNAKLAALLERPVHQIAYRASRLGLKKTPEYQAAKLRIDLTEEQIKFIKENFQTLNNPQIAKALGLNLQFLRKKIYELGLYRMRLEYWSEEQVEFLKLNYQTMGDLELSEICEQRWPKSKRWTIKHIEKKRLYLKLSRTTLELAKIKQRNIDQGRFIAKGVSKWLAKGYAEDGDIRMRLNHLNKKEPRIKVNGAYVNWARYTWEQTHGPIPEGMAVSFKDGDPENTHPENLELLTRTELANKGVKQSGIKLTDNYIAGMLSRGNPDIRQSFRKSPGLIQLKRQQLILKRTIKQHGKSN